jgi:hypothetical protein
MSARRPRRPAVTPNREDPWILLRLRPPSPPRRGFPRCAGGREREVSARTAHHHEPVQLAHRRIAKTSAATRQLPSPEQTGALHKYLHVLSARSVSEGRHKPQVHATLGRRGSSRRADAPPCVRLSVVPRSARRPRHRLRRRLPQALADDSRQRWEACRALDVGVVLSRSWSCGR